MGQCEPLTVQAQRAYETALNSACPDWRAVAEMLTCGA